jgi:small subunit ribosomal protein S20
VRSSVKKFVGAVQKKDVVESEASLKDMIKKIDTAAGKGIIKKNSASRKKSRMQRLLNSLSSAKLPDAKLSVAK